MLKIFIVTSMLLTSSAFAQSQASATIGASINVVEPMGIDVKNDMVFPTVTVDQTDLTINSDVSNAKLSTRGQANSSYSVTIEDGKGQFMLAGNIPVNTQIVGSRSGSNIRTFDANGRDTFEIKGTINFNKNFKAPSVPGQYTGNATVLVEYL